MSVVLSEHLPLLASAPEGVAKLRNLILGLAISGKLVAQNPDDQPAKVAFDRFRISRKQPVESLLKKFTIPSSWLWCEVGDLSVLRTGATPSTLKAENYGGEIRWLVSGDIHKREITDCDGRITEQGLTSSNCKILPENSVLIALNGQGKTRATVALLRVPAACNQSLVSITPVSDEVLVPEFLYLNLRFRYYEIRDITGQKQRRGLNMGLVADLSVSVPPVAEQHRIVAKVDELMALCDRLEAEQADAASAHARLVDTLLGTLTQSTDSLELVANWQRLAEHFDTLFTTEASIDALKQTVLQLAVMGKLVPQDPDDESASELLKRIAAKRALMESDGVYKKAKPLPPVNDEERHHSIPASWEYVRLQDVCFAIIDGTHQTPKYTESGRPFLSAQNVKPFRFMPESFRYVSEEDYQGYVKTTKPEFGDVLLTRVGAMIGEAAVIDKRMDFAIYVSLALLKPCQPFVSPEFVTLWLNSPFGTHSSIRDTLGRGVSAGNLNLGMIRAFALPLPPLAEQHRIVAKVDELMALCDRLKADLATARQHQARLTDTLIESALEAA